MGIQHTVDIFKSHEGSSTSWFFSNPRQTEGEILFQDARSRFFVISEKEFSRNSIKLSIILQIQSLPKKSLFSDKIVFYNVLNCYADLY